MVLSTSEWLCAKQAKFGFEAPRSKRELRGERNNKGGKTLKDRRYQT
jgi:hypothetical protein